MGGKTKQSQRTKNNARPSSSGRSAELLCGIKLEAGTVSIAGTQLPALFPSLAPSVDPLVNPQLQLCLKKLNKKDPITKIKALQELSELVNKQNVDDVVSALASWCHYYRILTADPDRKVRERTQLCHGSIVSVCGRRIAPHLKQLMPAWLEAQYDEHAPAMTHAQNSLARTFPDAKLPEVLSFCKEEVLTHLLDVLLNEGGGALGKKSDSPEERQLQESRAVLSSLRGLEYCVRHLPLALDGWLWGRGAPLLAAGGGWQRSAGTDLTIRAAWFSTMSSIIARFPASFGADYGTKMMRVLVQTRESNPDVAATLWDCLLVFMHNVPDWHQYLEKKDLLIKRILDLLESGGWGDARRLSATLLPLLASLPPLLLSREFHLAFFDAMFSGLSQKSILSSKSERQCWITSLDECLRYLSTTGLSYAAEVVSAVHRSWLERVLAGAGAGEGAGGAVARHLVGHSATTMSSLVRYWLKQAHDRGDHRDRYETLVRNFWQNIGSTLVSQIDTVSLDHDDIDELLKSHIHLLQTLQSSVAQQPNKKYGIKFFTGEAEAPAEERSEPEPGVERYLRDLLRAVQSVCARYLEFAGSTEIASPVLSPLVTLVSLFSSRALFAGIARQMACESPLQLYSRVLRGWLRDDTMRCRAALDLVFVLMSHLDEADQDKVFDTFKQFTPSVVEWCVSLSLSYPMCVSHSARRWLRGSLVETTVTSLCARLVRTGDSRDRTLLMMCLRTDDTGELVVSSAAVESALQQLSASLYVMDGALEERSATAARLAGSLPPHAALLTALLALTVSLQRHDPRLSDATWMEVRAAWQSGVASLPAPQRRQFLREAAAALLARLRLDDASSELGGIEHVVSLCPYLLWGDGDDGGDSGDGDGGDGDVLAFTRCVLDVARTDPLRVEAYAVRHELLKGNLNCQIENNPVIKAIANEELQELCKDVLIVHVNTCLFRLMYLRTLFLNRTDADRYNWCNTLLAEIYFDEEFVKCLHDYVVICSLCEGYAFWPHYKLIEEAKNRLGALLEDIITEISPENRKNISSFLKTLSTANGFFWAYSKKYFNDRISLDDNRPFGRYDYDIESDTIETTETEYSEGISEDEQETRRSIDTNRHVIEVIEGFLSGRSMLHAFHELQAECKQSSDRASALRTKYYLMIVNLHTAHGHERGVQVPPTPTPTAADLTSSCCPDIVIDAYYAHNHTMLFDKDISDAPWKEIVYNSSVCRFLAGMVEARGWDAAAHQWDFTNIALCSLLTSVEMSKHKWGTAKVALAARSALEMFGAVARFVAALPAQCARRQPAAHVAALLTEWNDIYAPDLHHNLFSIILFVLESSKSGAVSSSHIAVVEALVESAEHLQWTQGTAEVGGGGGGLRHVVAVCVGALRGASHVAYKYLAYSVLSVLLKPLVLEDAEKLASWSQKVSEDSEECPLELTLLYYDEALYELQDLVECACSHVRVCEEVCTMVPFTDGHVLSLGWLLLADLVNRQCMLARGDLTHQYIQIYREQKYAEPLLTTALRLLPRAVLMQAAGWEGEGEGEDSADCRDMFTDAPRTDVYAWCGSEVISALACRGVWWAVRGAGAGGARGWRGAAHHRHAQILDNITASYITPHVVKEEFALLQKKGSDIEDTEVTLNWSAYEVSCVLTVDDCPIELLVTLSRQHPLVLPRLVADHSAAGNINWILMYLGYQNGTILNALKMWTVSVNNKLERAPQCYICYCRLHHASGRLPTVHCRTCHNKYHGVCLRKWFMTSNKMTCPLCRGVF